jgi:hypothetical protein
METSQSGNPCLPSGYKRGLCSALFSISELSLTNCIHCYSKYRQQNNMGGYVWFSPWAGLMEAQTGRRMQFINQNGSPSGDRTNQASGCVKEKKHRCAFGHLPPLRDRTSEACFPISESETYRPTRGPSCLRTQAQFTVHQLSQWTVLGFYSDLDPPNTLL